MKLSCHSPPLKTAWRTLPSCTNPHRSNAFCSAKLSDPVHAQTRCVVLVAKRYSTSIL